MRRGPAQTQHEQLRGDYRRQLAKAISGQDASGRDGDFCGGIYAHRCYHLGNIDILMREEHKAPDLRFQQLPSRHGVRPLRPQASLWSALSRFGSAALDTACLRAVFRGIQKHYRRVSLEHVR